MDTSTFTNDATIDIHVTDIILKSNGSNYPLRWYFTRNRKLKMSVSVSIL